jgi:hypothetical protein
MAIDASIPLQVRSPQFEPQSNALARIIGMQGQMRQNELGAMQLAQARQQATDEKQWRGALGNVDPGTPEGLQALMRINPARALQIQKARLDAQESQSKIDERKGKMAKDSFELARTQAQTMLDLISSAKDQASYDAAMATGRAMGLKPTGPAQFDPAFVSQAQAMALTRVQRLEQENKDRSHGLAVGNSERDSANQLLVKDKAGNWVTNAPLLAAKQSVASAGKSVISISNNTEKTLFGNVAENVGKDIVDTSQSARSAVGTVDNVTRMRAALDSGKAITGTAANQVRALSQLGYTLGIGPADSPDTLAKTAELVQGMAKLELGAAASMKGQGQITENERALLKRAESGDITLTTPEIRVILNAAERNAKKRIALNQSNVDVLKRSPGAASVIPFLQLNGADSGAPRMPTSDEIAAEAQRRAGLRGGK